MMQKFGKFFVVGCFFFVHSSAAVFGTTYYVSSSLGNDNNSMSAATNPSTPWRTLSMVNRTLAKFAGGDSILLRSGDAFQGPLLIKDIGKALFFGSYGGGLRPLIKGLQEMEAWSYVRDGVYVSNETLEGCVFVIINGREYPVGREPNSGFTEFNRTSYINNSDKIRDLFRYWVGAEIVIRTEPWLLDRHTIEPSKRDAFLDFGINVSQTPLVKYFIQNHIQTLNSFGEWYYDESMRKVFIHCGSDSPTGFKVEIPTVETLLSINNSKFITVSNIAFRGASKNCIVIKNCGNISLLDCHITHSYLSGINASNSSDLNIEGSIITNSFNNALSIEVSCSRVTVRSNKIENTALISGMGGSGTGTYQAIMSFASNSLIESNSILNTGYNAIYFGGDSSVVRNNYINGFCLVKDDGAAIYVGDWKPWVQKKIINNEISNRHCLKMKAGGGAEGIYVDDRSGHVEIVLNKVTNSSSGIKIHNAHDVVIARNKLINNDVQLLIASDNVVKNSPVRNIKVFQNTLSAEKVSQLCLNIYSKGDDIKRMAVFTDNVYRKANSMDFIIRVVTNIWTKYSNTEYMSLADWQMLYANDLDSRELTGRQN